ncbi:hypothetical protein P691DRAFT_267800 [Macrolepiota fuliginosa MF-IS2]|uniref:Uncharacterized protein n=1 Tax=Macrolepiota fuliginosa MF-IS2 TaxID=1400762 RepID=A0A9P5XJK5_9AGAR|nr:hypothetical protein P691DRAFT_267800 [Macrolepiota fuliginosa MF-IS2]
MRPPPLQLKIDNRYPASSRRGRAAPFFAALYHANWRNIVLAVSGVNALRFTLSALNAYHDVDVDNNLHLPHLAGASSSLCSMYLTAGLIDIFGILGVSMQRVIFIRIYSCLAVVSAFIVTVAGAVAALTFYIFGGDVIQECTVLAMNGELASKSIFRGRPWPLMQHGMKSTDAETACYTAWLSEVPSQITSVFLFSLLPSIIYCLLVYVYYRQITDPAHPAYLKEGHPDSSMQMDDWPSYSPLYNSASAPTVPKEQPPQPSRKKRVPRLPALMQSSSPMEYLMTPGPPSFGPSKVQTYEPYIHAAESGSSIGYWVDKRNR